RRQRDRGQNTDDRDHDHQFNQGKTLLQTFHLSHLHEVSTCSLPRRTQGCSPLISKGHAITLGTARFLSAAPPVGVPPPSVPRLGCAVPRACWPPGKGLCRSI